MLFLFIYVHCTFHAEREGGQWAVFCTSPQSFIDKVFLFVGLTTLGTLVNFYWLVHSVDCSNVSTTNLNLQMGYFCVSKIGRCTSIYPPLSYPLNP